MKTKTVITFQLLTVSLFISGCASIFGKTKYPVSLSSMPSVANVLITNNKGDTVFNGTTPATVSLKGSSGFFKKASYDLTFRADGFQEKKHTIKATINGFYFGNILIGGVLGMLIIDPATGRMYAIKSTDQNIHLTLEPLSAKNKNASFNIVSLADIPVNQRENLVEIK